MTTPNALAYPGTDLEAMSFAPRYHEWILSEVEHVLGRRAVEVGAGRGQLTRLLARHPERDVTAFEPSTEMFPYLSEVAATLAGVSAVHGFFSADVVEGADSVSYINVLEHIDDDVAELREAHRALRRDGHLIVFVPALRRLYSPFDRSIGHFRRYHRRPLEDLVRSAGFEIVACRYFDVLGVAPWLVNFVVLRQQMRPGAVGLYDRWVVPISRRVESRMAPPIGKNLLLIARKP